MKISKIYKNWILIEYIKKYFFWKIFCIETYLIWKKIIMLYLLLYLNFFLFWDHSSIYFNLHSIYLNIHLNDFIYKYLKNCYYLHHHLLQNFLLAHQLHYHSLFYCHHLDIISFKFNCRSHICPYIIYFIFLLYLYLLLDILLFIIWRFIAIWLII